MIPMVQTARNVEEAFQLGLFLMQDSRCVREQSRNGWVTVWNGPVITTTERPMERVLFNPLRNANPFFHLFESLWMLSGREDLPWVAYFNKRMTEYSDDGGKTQPAAYGFRWREYFGHDQLEMVIEELKRDPNTRRVVLGMWDPGSTDHPGDLARAFAGSKDVPCNTQCYFTLRDAKLHMGVTCRSNDLVWGAHGANAVHFSVLLEYVAARVGVEVGTMTQFSWNYHLYDGVLKAAPMEVASKAVDHYGQSEVEVTPLFTPQTIETFEAELPIFMEWASPENRGGLDIKRRFKRPPQFADPFLREVAKPMLRVWDLYKAADLEGASSFAHLIRPGSDWQRAALEWTNRRLGKDYTYWHNLQKERGR